MSRRESPTLAELRGRVHKQRHREIGNWLARRVGRPSAVYGTWLALRMGLSAHVVTTLALAANIAAALGVATGSRAGFVAGVVLAHLAFWLDHVDGQVARWRSTASLSGVYLDYLMHHVASLALGFALGYGLAARTGDLRWAAAGFVLALGWTALGLYNDCRYKAYFQRLKLEGRSYRIDGGSGARPMPPAPWTGRGLSAFTWPLAKACEPHVVLLALTALAVLALVAPASWTLLWKAGVIESACVASALAIGRSARLVMRGQVDAEFDTWFQPWQERALDEPPEGRFDERMPREGPP